jgi:hypothetical protein
MTPTLHSDIGGTGIGRELAQTLHSAVKHDLRRCAVQGSPALLAAGLLVSPAPDPVVASDDILNLVAKRT